MMMGAFSLMVYCLMRWGWLSLSLLFIWLLLVWLIPKAIHFTHELHAWVIGVAIETCYCSHKSNFRRSDLSLRQFTLLMNCMLGLSAWLSKLAIVLTNLTFICLIYYQANLLLLWIARLIIPFIWTPMQSWLLDHLATSLDLFAISGLLHYWEGLSSNRRSMKKLWCWRLKSRSNCVQSAILLPLHLRLSRWQELIFAIPLDAKKYW